MSSDSNERRPQGLFTSTRPANARPDDDYVLLSEQEAEERAVQTVLEWQPRRDVWALAYGGAAPVVLSAAPPLLIIDRLRRMHRATRGGGRLLAAMPAVLMPASLVAFLQYRAMTHVLMGRPCCPVCLEVRTVCGQMAAGVAMPSLLATMGTFLNFKSFSSVRGLPEPMTREHFRWIGSALYKCRGIIGWSALAQAVAVSGVLWLQQSQWMAVNQELISRMEADQTPKKDRPSALITRK